MNVSGSYESVTICPSFWFPSSLYSVTFSGLIGPIVRLSSVSGEMMEFCLIFCQLIAGPAIPYPPPPDPPAAVLLVGQDCEPLASLWPQVSDLLHLTVSWPGPHLFSPYSCCLTESLPCGQLNCGWCWRPDSSNWKTGVNILTCLLPSRFGF